VDNFARRIASFEKRPLELAKKLVNARAGIPSEAERRSSTSRLLPRRPGLKLKPSSANCFKTAFSKEAILNSAWVTTSDTVGEKNK